MKGVFGEGGFAVAELSSLRRDPGLQVAYLGDVAAQEVRQIGARRHPARSCGFPAPARAPELRLEAGQLLPQGRDLVCGGPRGFEVRDLVLDSGDGIARPLRPDRRVVA